MSRHPYDDTMPTPLARSFEQLQTERDLLGVLLARDAAADRTLPERWLIEFRALDAATSRAAAVGQAAWRARVTT